MRIVVTHLTRMAPGFICVAGIDVDTDRHVRPRCNRSHLPLRWASMHGGPFGIGSVVDLGHTRYIGQPPQVEDYHFHEHRLRHVERFDAIRFWALLRSQCDTRLQRIFGPELRLAGTGCAASRGEGRASLGCLVPSRIHDLTINWRGNVRLSFDVGRVNLDLSVSDLRFYRMDDAAAEWVVDRNRVESVRYALLTATPVILCVGLTRPFQRSGDDAPRHWLQVNTIHLEDDPLGDLEFQA